MSTKLCHFDIVSEFNLWTIEERRKALPTAFDDIAARWYVQLEDDVKLNFPDPRDSFIARFETAEDQHQMEQEFHDLRCHTANYLAVYLLRLQEIASKLNKTNIEVFKRFMMYLPKKQYRYVKAQAPMSISEAIINARDAFALFGLE